MRIKNIKPDEIIIPGSYEIDPKMTGLFMRLIREGETDYLPVIATHAYTAPLYVLFGDLPNTGQDPLKVAKTFKQKVESFERAQYCLLDEAESLNISVACMLTGRDLMIWELEDKKDIYAIKSMISYDDKNPHMRYDDIPSIVAGFAQSCTKNIDSVKTLDERVKELIFFGMDPEYISPLMEPEKVH